MISSQDFLLHLLFLFLLSLVILVMVSVAFKALCNLKIGYRLEHRLLSVLLCIFVFISC